MKNRVFFFIIGVKEKWIPDWTINNFINGKIDLPISRKWNDNCFLKILKKEKKRLYLIFLDFSEDSRFQFQPYLPENIPEDILGPEDTIFNEDEILSDIMPEVIPVYLEDQTPDRVPDSVADEDDLTETLENLENLQTMFYAPTNARRKRPSSNDWVILKDLEEKNDENVSTMDFDYNDSAASQDGDNDDSVYYGLDAPAAFETIFDRRERLDVKKPGPFFANSQNNFFLDKVIY